jgi:hypothetical protein
LALPDEHPAAAMIAPVKTASVEDVNEEKLPTAET